MSLSTRINAIFRRAWRAYGKPTMTAVPPLDEWTLPAGYAYSASYDGIQTGSGAVLNDLDAFMSSGYFASEVIYIVPIDPTADMQTMIAAGVVPSGQVEVWILQEDVATVRDAFSVQLMGQWYDVLEAGHGPAGHSAGIWARVRLQRRS